MTVAHRGRFLEASMGSHVPALFVPSAASRAFIVAEEMLPLTPIITITTVSLHGQSQSGTGARRSCWRA